MERAERAAELFVKGYNCAQAVTAAFCEEIGMTEKQAAKMASSFGGGMGRMREVCGAVSGMALVAGILYGYDTPGDTQGQHAQYALVQELAGAFKAEAGTIICRELLGNPTSDPAPTPRTAEFYKQRPCARFVMLAARILDDYIKAHPVTA